MGEEEKEEGRGKKGEGTRRLVEEWRRGRRDIGRDVTY